MEDLDNLDKELDAIEVSTDAVEDHHPPILPPAKPDFLSNKLLNSPCKCEDCTKDKYLSVKSSIDYNNEKKLADFDKNTIQLIEKNQPRVFKVLHDWDKNIDLPKVENKPRGRGAADNDSMEDGSSDSMEAEDGSSDGMEVDSESSEDEEMEEGDVDHTSLVGTIVKVGGNGLPTIPSYIIPVLATAVPNLSAWNAPGIDFLTAVIIEYGDEYVQLDGGKHAALSIAHVSTFCSVLWLYVYILIHVINSSVSPIENYQKV